MAADVVMLPKAALVCFRECLEPVNPNSGLQNASSIIAACNESAGCCYFYHLQIQSLMKQGSGRKSKLLIPRMTDVRQKPRWHETADGRANARH